MGPMEIIGEILSSLVCLRIQVCPDRKGVPGSIPIQTLRIHVWYIYLHEWLIFMVFMKVNIPYMDPQGKDRIGTLDPILGSRGLDC